MVGNVASPSMVCGVRANILPPPRFARAKPRLRSLRSGAGVSILALRAVMTVDRIIVVSGFCITALGAAFAGDYAAASVSLAAASGASCQPLRRHPSPRARLCAIPSRPLPWQEVSAAGFAIWPPMVVESAGRYVARGVDWVAVGSASSSLNSNQSSEHSAPAKETEQHE